MRAFALPLLLGLASGTFLGWTLRGASTPRRGPEEALHHVHRAQPPERVAVLPEVLPDPELVLPETQQGNRASIEDGSARHALPTGGEHEGAEPEQLAQETRYGLTVLLDAEAALGTLVLEALCPGGAPLRVERSVMSQVMTFDSLRAGRYRLTLTAPEAPPRRLALSIPSQKCVDLAARSENALSVAIKDPEGYLAEAGFEDGDVVFGSRGEPLRSREGLQELLLQVVRREVRSVTVLRADVPREVEIDPRRILDREGWGGRIAPTNLPTF